MIIFLSDALNIIRPYQLINVEDPKSVYTRVLQKVHVKLTTLMLIEVISTWSYLGGTQTNFLPY